MVNIPISNPGGTRTRNMRAQSIARIPSRRPGTHGNTAVAHAVAFMYIISTGRQLVIQKLNVFADDDL